MSENEGYFNELGDPIVDYMEQATQDEVDRLRTFLNGPARANLTRYFWQAESRIADRVEAFEDSLTAIFQANGLPGSETLIQDAVEDATNKLRMHETKKMMLEDFFRGSIDLGRIK